MQHVKVLQYECIFYTNYILCPIFLKKIKQTHPLEGSKATIIHFPNI